VTGKTRTKSIAGLLVRYFNSSSALKNSVLALLLVVIGGLAGCHGKRAWHDLAADLNPHSIPNLCNMSDEDAAGLNGDLSVDVHAERNYAGTIAHMLKEEKFEELDCVADRARSSKEQFSGGGWKLHTLYTGLDSPIQFPVTHATEEDWDELLQRLQRWVTVRSESATARIALASAYLGYAGDARGDGDANTVSESGWKLIGERTEEARRILDEAAALPTKCPEWYVATLLVAQNQGWNATEKRKLFERAFKFEPGYHYSAGVLAYYLLPKWGGKVGDTENFIQEAADRIGGEQGDIFYFQVATMPHLICGCDEDPHLSWERIERGFEASEKQYEVSLVNLNRMAYLGAHFGKLDAIVADKALARIGEQWDEQTWEKEEDFESVKEWATKWAPIMAKEHEIEAAAEANMRTVEGSRYKATFEGKLRELAKQCVLTQGASVGQLEALINVGAKGTVEDVTVGGPGGVCVYEKLRALQQENVPPFPPPSHAPYWVKIDMDWAEFTPVAAK